MLNVLNGKADSEEEIVRGGINKESAVLWLFFRIFSRWSMGRFDPDACDSPILLNN
jgi:hypothetical protein